MNWELKQSSLDQKGKPVETIASELLNAHGCEKTTKQCQDQWHYIVTTFRRGGYQQFKDQINLIHLLTPTLLTSHTNNIHLSTLTVRKNQQQEPFEGQKITVFSSSEVADVSLIHASKKRKIETHQNTILTSINETGNGNETKASKNVASYVKINVPNNTIPMKHQAEITTNEPKNHEKLVSHCIEKGLDISADTNNRHSVLRNLQKSPSISRQKYKKGSDNIKNINSSSTDIKSTNAEPSLEKKDFIKLPKGKVQVEVLSIKENENIKLIECRTMPDIIPSRTIRLHYPADHPLPKGVRHLYIPWAMVHPDAGAQSRTESSSKCLDTSVKSDKCSIPLSSKVSSVSNIEHELDCEGEQNKDKKGISESNAMATCTNGSAEKGTILKLLSQYSQHCQQEKQRLHSVIQETHHHHLSVLKEILSLFKELQESI